jgi:hypothetical protein
MLVVGNGGYIIGIGQERPFNMLSLLLCKPVFPLDVIGNCLGLVKIDGLWFSGGLDGRLDFLKHGDEHFNLLNRDAHALITGSELALSLGEPKVAHIDHGMNLELVPANHNLHVTGDLGLDPA